jgi:hypothetical protein
LPCNGNLDTNIIEFAKKHFAKKYPQCSIITGKISGCNHIICSKCNYEWCWLCNKRYRDGHYNQGKCKGYQFFKPQDEYDIKLAFEGKIQLNESQIQPDFNNIDDIDRIREVYQGFSCMFKFLILFLYIIFGHPLYSLAISFQDRFFFVYIFFSYSILELTYFFFIIFLNLIMLIPYLIIYSFPEFIYHCYNDPTISKLPVFFYNLILLILYIFYGGILNILYIKHFIMSYRLRNIEFARLKHLQQLER